MIAIDSKPSPARKAGAFALAGSSTRIPVVLILSLIFAWGTGSSGAQRRVDIGTALDGKMLPDEEVATFRTADRLYPSNLVARRSFVRALPVSTRQLVDITFQVGQHDRCSAIVGVAEAIGIGDVIAWHRTRHQAAIIPPVEAQPWSPETELVLHMRGLVIPFVMVDAKRKATLDGCARAGRLGWEKAGRY